MKFIYDKPILDQITDEKIAAREQGKKLKEVHLTMTEWVRFRKEITPYIMFKGIPKDLWVQFNGIIVKLMEVTE